MQKELESGKVYVLGFVDEIILPYKKLRTQIGEIASDFFSKRYAIDSKTSKPFIPYGSDHNVAIKKVNDFIISHIPNDAKKILDIGGSGGSRIVNIGVGLEKHVVDIAIPEKRKGEVYFTQADINKVLPYQDESFDCITSLWTIGHVFEENRRGLIEEASRILKPGGYFYLNEVKKPDTEKGRKDFEKLGEGYEFGDYFYAVFEALTKRGEKKVREESRERGKILHDIELDTKKFKKVSYAMYGSALTFERLEQYYKDLFSLEDIKLVPFRKNQSRKEIPITPEAEGVWLAFLKKK